MPLVAGGRLGPSEIVAKLGEGGMGEVYRARDTKLNRDVALKVLPDIFVGDPDRLARFTREAETLASLNHPNIAHVYDAGKPDGASATAFFLMELVEGEDLSAQLARGPIALSDAFGRRDGEIQLQYDRETGHGTDARRQNEWQSRVEEWLRTLPSSK